MSLGILLGGARIWQSLGLLRESLGARALPGIHGGCLSTGYNTRRCTGQITASWNQVTLNSSYFGIYQSLKWALIQDLA